MRAAVFADIHGNLEALEAVFTDMTRLGAEVRYCLGDVIGYGADPEACLARVLETCTVMIRGNHEEALLRPEQQLFMNPAALASMCWTQARLDDTVRRIIAGWPLVYSDGDARWVHASPEAPLKFRYLQTAEAKESMFAAFSEKLCFCGHTHAPCVAREHAPGQYQAPGEAFHEVEAKARYLINVGSVGQPRDNDPRACWVLVADDPLRVEIRRVAYNVSQAQEKILRAGLPPLLAERLALGR